MPALDLSELLVDPDLSHDFQIVRQQQGVGDDGVAYTKAAVTYDVVGVIVPKGKELVRVEEGQRMQAKLEVYVAFELTAGQDDVEPDVIVWGKRSYRVMAVEDYSQFGNGWVKATCYELSYGNRTGVPIT